MDRRIERTRAAVLDATVGLVAHRGSQVGMTEIADAAGVSRKAVYENFGSREHVLRCATQALLSEIPSRAQGTGLGCATPWGAVLPTVAEHVETFCDFYRAVLSGPGCSLARDAVVEHTVAQVRAARESGDGATTGVAPEHDRFIAHGLVGTMADALVRRQCASLRAMAHALADGLARTAASTGAPAPQAARQSSE